MLDFSISKLAVLALLALLVLGPEKLPKVAAQLGRWTGRAKVMARNLRAQLEQEVSYDELLKEKQKAEAALKAARDSTTTHMQNVAATAQSAASTINRSVDPNITPPTQASTDDKPHDQSPSTHT